MRVLISGFEPFGGRELNPTSLLIEALNQNQIPYPDEVQLVSMVLPVTFQDAFHVLQERINEFNPDVVISLGQAAGRSAIELEALALNKIQADIPDNLGVKPEDKLINHLGRESYPSTLPLQGIEGALKDADLPVKISQDAGKFVCNYLFYRMMEANLDTQRLCGFIHVPLLPEQAKKGEPTLSFDEMKKALEIILNYITY